MCCAVPSTYDKSTVDFFQNLLLIQSHGLSFPLLYPLLLQFLAGVHLARGSHLAGAHLPKQIDEGISQVAQAHCLE